MKRLLATAAMGALLLTGCSDTVDSLKQGAEDTVRSGAEQAFVSGARSAAGNGTLDTYSDEQILQFGRDACNKISSAGGSAADAVAEAKSEAPQDVPQVQWDAVVKVASAVLCTNDEQ